MSKKREEPMSTDLLVPETPPPAPLATRGVEDVPIGAILNMAVEKGISTETMEKLVALYERVNANAAKQKFARAMSAFKAECPQIPKSATAKIVTKSGASYAYAYAPLEQIDKTTAPFLGKHGFSYRWDFDEKDGKVAVVCILEHCDGHSISSRFNCSNESTSGMSAQQRNSAAFTTAKRQSLQGVLGLTTCDEDTDGNEPPPDAGPKITEPQAANIEHMLEETKSNRPVFLKWCGVETVADIPASRFKAIMEALEAKRTKKP